MGKTIIKPKLIANMQANYYEKKVQKIKANLPRVRDDPLKYLRVAFEKWSPVGGGGNFSIKQITPAEVIKMIGNLKDSHAFGIDRLDAATMKMAKLILAAPIAYVINLSLQTRTFPQRWKLSRVLPLLKSKDSESLSPAGYRPVSQLPVISKLAERTVQLQLLEYLESSGLISQDHHAYRQLTSTTTALA